MQQMTGACISPLRSAIPQKFWNYFPDSLLDSAAVASYRDERLLDPFFDMIFVHPRLGENFEINYVCTNSVVKNLQSTVSPGVFDILLTHGYISDIEHRL